MRNFFKQLEPKTFQILCITLCLTGDLSFAGYIYQTFSDKKSFLANFEIMREPLQQAFRQQGMILPKNFEHEIFHLMIQSLLMLMCMFIIFHSIIYAFYYFQKRFAFLYIRLMAFVGTLGALSFVTSLILDNFLWGTIFGIVTLGYIFIIFGTYYFPISPKSKTGQQSSD